jgi:pyroglutamyl-peptidase
MASQPVLLLTGFEPFDGSPINPSALLLSQLVAPPGWILEGTVLPVDTVRLPTMLESLFCRLMPSIVLSLGEARGSSHFRVEASARNRLDFARPDNAGIRVRNQPIAAGGPERLQATLSAQMMLASLKASGVPALASDDAGGFLCNQVLYSMCLRFSETSTRVGFLHLPSLPEQGFGPGVSLSKQVRAVQDLLNSLAIN